MKHVGEIHHLHKRTTRRAAPTVIRCDNRGECKVTQTGNYSRGKRHIAVRLTRISETSKRGETTITFTPSEHQKEDMLRKALARIQLSRTIITLVDNRDDIVHIAQS